MNQIVSALAAWAKDAGHKGIEQLAKELEALDAKSPLEAAVLKALGETLAREGPSAIGRVVDALEDIVSSERSISETHADHLTLKQRSDLLAALQIAEAKDKRATLERLSTIGESLGRVLKAALLVAL